MTALTHSKDLERFFVGSSMIDVIVFIESVCYLDNKDSCYCNARTDDGRRLVIKGYKKAGLILKESVMPHSKVAFSDLSATKVYFPQFSDLKVDLLFTENSSADLLKHVSKDEVTPFNNQDEVPLSKVKNHHGQIIWTRGYLKVPLRLGYYPTGSTEKRYAGVLYDDSDKNLRVEVVINNDNEMLKRFFELDEVLVRGKVFIKGNAHNISVETYADIKLVAPENQKTIQSSNRQY